MADMISIADAIIVPDHHCSLASIIDALLYCVHYCITGALGTDALIRGIDALMH